MSYPAPVSASAAQECVATPVGFEPTRGDPIGLAGRRLSHSAKVSLAKMCPRSASFRPPTARGEGEGQCPHQESSLGCRGHDATS